MNKLDRILYSAKHSRRMKLFEAQFLKRIFYALQSQIKPVIEKLKESGVEQAIHSVDRIVINSEVSKVILDIYKVVALYFANKTVYDLRPTKEQKAGFGFNEEFLNSILNYFSSHLLNKAVVPITETTKELIRNLLNKGFTEGLGVDKIANELESDELILWRARMIVRTEANKAMSYGQKLGESKSLFESTKTWIAANDHRTRHSHRDVDDETIDFNKYFRVPIYKRNIKVGVDLMDGPGDIYATAGNVINCRCTLAFKGKRDRQGKLIRKRNISVLLPSDIKRPHTVIVI